MTEPRSRHQHSSKHLAAVEKAAKRLSDAQTRLDSARKAFCAAVAEALEELGGVGFWNPVTTTLGALGNGAELRPVTYFAPLTGCGHY